VISHSLQPGNGQIAAPACLKGGERGRSSKCLFFSFLMFVSQPVPPGYHYYTPN
jgi:hypothetical protein